jgi:hypothetical protein
LTDRWFGVRYDKGENGLCMMMNMSLIMIVS